MILQYLFVVILSLPNLNQCLQSFACFNKPLVLSCPPTHRLLIKSAYLSLIDSDITNKCGVSQNLNCNYKNDMVIEGCSGRPRCNITHNQNNLCFKAYITAQYSCILASTIDSKCKVTYLIGNGYISSPNYPKPYYNKADCQWIINVKKRQTIRIIIHKFNLNPKVENECGDSLTILSSSSSNDHQNSLVPRHVLCSIIGMKTMNFNTRTVTIKFKTSSHTMPKTGFIIEYQAIGPACDDLSSLGNYTTVKYLQTPRAPVDSHLGDRLIANISCDTGYHTYVDTGARVSNIQLLCVGDKWQHDISPCTDEQPIMTTQRKPGEISDDSNYQIAQHSSSYIGTILGIICSIISLLLLFTVLVYILRRRKRCTRKRDDWARVNSDMQYSNALNEARVQSSAHNYYTPSKCGSINRKVYNYDYNNINTCADDVDTSAQMFCDHVGSRSRQATISRNNTGHSCSQYDTSSQCAPSLVGHAAGIPSHCQCRRSSVADLLDNDNSSRCYTPPNRMQSCNTPPACCTPVSVPRCGWSDDRTQTGSCRNTREPQRTHRPLTRDRRSKSGQWSRTSGNSHSRPKERSRSCEILDQRRSLSCSAPDLLNEVEMCHTPEQSFTSFHTPRKLFY